MKHSHIFVAGTFDHFHRGHQAVIGCAFENGENVTIGITSDAFVLKYKPHIADVEPLSIRKANLEKFLQGKNYTAEIVVIDDPYEPAASGEFDSIVVTEQNKQTGVEINTKRKAKGLKELALVECSLVSAEDSQPISSTRIRAGEIDQTGNLILPDSLRQALKTPFGSIVDQEQGLINAQGKTIITVGDITTDFFVSHESVPSLAIIDLHVQRRPYKTLLQFSFPESVTVKHIQSGPGYISQEALHAITQWNQEIPTVLVVSGEDDLLVLPAIIYAEEGTHLYYGQPNVGLVEVIINQSTKKKAKELLTQFTTV